MDDIVKVNIQLANIADLADVDTIYAKYFPGYLPARTVIGVSELPAGALVQMDAVMSNAESTPPQGKFSLKKRPAICRSLLSNRRGLFYASS